MPSLFAPSPFFLMLPQVFMFFLRCGVKPWPASRPTSTLVSLPTSASLPTKTNSLFYAWETRPILWTWHLATPAYTQSRPARTVSQKAAHSRRRVRSQPVRPSHGERRLYPRRAFQKWLPALRPRGNHRGPRGPGYRSLGGYGREDGGNAGAAPHD
ncbi:hypothetical protein CPB85DRAFT_941434 [Mucidula mucida]|nr:hypothetical protein CPB85DRAFT_941434 [Mucidula mucida]